MNATGPPDFYSTSSMSTSTSTSTIMLSDDIDIDNSPHDAVFSTAADFSHRQHWLRRRRELHGHGMEDTSDAALDEQRKLAFAQLVGHRQSAEELLALLWEVSTMSTALDLFVDDEPLDNDTLPVHSHDNCENELPLELDTDLQRSPSPSPIPDPTSATNTPTSNLKLQRKIDHLEAEVHHLRQTLTDLDEEYQALRQRLRRLAVERVDALRRGKASPRVEWENSAYQPDDQPAAEWRNMMDIMMGTAQLPLTQSSIAVQTCDEDPPPTTHSNEVPTSAATPTIKSRTAPYPLVVVQNHPPTWRDYVFGAAVLLISLPIVLGGRVGGAKHGRAE